MVNIFKILTQSGRRDIVWQILEENVTPDIVVAECAKAANLIIAKSITDANKCMAINDYVIKATDVVSGIAKAAEDGVITADEMRDILVSILKNFNMTLPGILDGIKQAIVCKVP